MANLPNASIVAHTIEFLNNGQQNLLTLHYEFIIVSGGPYTDEQATDALHTVFQANGGLHEMFANLINNTITGINTFYQPIYTLRFRKRKLTNNRSAGLRTGDAAPQNSAAVVTLRGDFSGPRFIGNKHLGGTTFNDMVFGAWTPDYLALLESFAQKCIQSVTVVQTGGGEFRFTPIIYSRTFPNLSAYITNYAIQDTVRVMRRRTLRVGS